ncbi:hypothetical protein L3X38_018690 [Prunus dulcis]|uniref:Protein FAR1-RELATED SEQUENCE n=1 Tax=Prunus dulcis TaxID=3755 RepID=A0AAD4WAH4_PRUDU|nr:hypothetical protein L3X38_018690 [Prunus dulcis]
MGVEIDLNLAEEDVDGVSQDNTNIFKSASFINEDTYFSEMEFHSDDKAYEFYSEYAKQKGFAASKVSCRWTKTSGEWIDTKFACTRYGKKRKSDAINPRPCLKIDCKASLEVKRRYDGKWFVCYFVREHNHDLYPEHIHYFPSNRRINSVDKYNINALHSVGVKPSKIFAAMAKQYGGYETIGFLEKDIRNHLDKERRLALESGDAKAMLELFTRMQEENPNFFYAMDLDEEQCLVNVFWVDANGREDYKIFGDVISFDTTCITNKYKMPFAPFIGVNNHSQSTLLGCALLADEMTCTFVWLMKTWIRAMGGKAPSAILTDQDQAMKAAITEVFPNARHRFCLWHILRKIPQKLGEVLRKHGNFMGVFNNCTYNSWTVEDFEQKWQNMVEVFELDNNEWIKSLFEDHKFWVPTYMRGAFFAGMSTTQRSESINSFFDKYLNKKTTLKEFVEKYKRVEARLASLLMESKEYSEALSVLSGLIKEVRRLVDKLLLVDIDLMRRKLFVFFPVRALSEFLIVFLSSSSSSLNLNIDHLPLAFIARKRFDFSEQWFLFFPYLINYKEKETRVVLSVKMVSQQQTKDSGSKKLGMVAPQDKSSKEMKSSKKMKFASSSAETEPTSQTTISDDSKSTGRGMSTMPRVVKRKLQKLRPIVEYNKMGKGQGGKKSVLASAAKKWKDFKSTLTRHYILPYTNDKEKLSHPPETYKFIEKAQWDAFVASRLSQDFESVHSQHAQIREKLEYNHRLSRKGYAGLEDELEETMPGVEIDRSTLWKRARQDKHGNIPDPKVAEKAKLIDELQKQVSEGKVRVDGSKDVLTMALGPEHPGRLRGVGAGISPRQYFNLPKPQRVSFDDRLKESLRVLLQEETKKIEAKAKEEALRMEARTKQLVEAEREHFLSQLSQLIHNFDPGMLKQRISQSPKNPMSDKASCSGGEVKSLHYEDDKAKNGEHQQEEEKEEEKRDEEKEEEKEKKDEEKHDDKVNEVGDYSNMEAPSSLKSLCRYVETTLLPEDKILEFTIDKEVFGGDRETFLLPEDITQFAGMEEIGATVVAVYMRRRYYGIGVVLFLITWRFLILPRRDILDNCFTIASWFFIVTLL